MLYINVYSASESVFHKLVKYPALNSESIKWRKNREATNYTKR